MKTRHCSLCVVLRTRNLERAPDILLGLKTHGNEKGRFALPGGHRRKRDRSDRRCARRELLEETALVADARAADALAVLRFFHGKRARKPATVATVYLMRRFRGAPRPTGEFREVRWFRLDALPWGRLAPAARLWLPLALMAPELGRVARLDVRYDRKRRLLGVANADDDP